jgi:asparagine synthase (glutamine-hydrolysing)
LLSGAGGDDIFTGYRRHYALMQESYWAWMPRSARSCVRRIAEQLPVDKPGFRRFAKAFRYADLEGDDRIASYFYWSPPHVVSRLCRPLLENAGSPYLAASLLTSSLASIPADTPRLNRMLYLESKHFLADHNLNYTDKMSMAAGVEVRVPFLDPDMISLAARLPVSYKQRGRTGKWILKKAMEPYLPREVIYRPKTGFGAPLRYWLRNPLRPVVNDVLSRESLQRRGIFDPSTVQELITMDRVGKIDGAYTIFSLICIELWCRLFLDGVGAQS